MLASLADRIPKLLVSSLQAAAQPFAPGGPAVLLAEGAAPAEVEDLLRRHAFFAGPAAPPPRVLQDAQPGELRRLLLSRAPLLLFGGHARIPAWARRGRALLYDVDHRRNPMDGWEWCRYALEVAGPRPDLADAQRRLAARLDRVRRLGHDKAYLFGTGPSLSKAQERDWSDGYRVVCNTIVRDPDLWRHVDPHFVVAGDAVYHFGHTAFARAFRQDLLARLREGDAAFVYPASFHAIVARELAEVADRLLPVPAGRDPRLHNDLARDFSLPAQGNVLPLLLLPLGFSLAPTVCLWGFDGRAPADRLFWANSTRHTYAELMPTLQAAHPAFFEHFAPAKDPQGYTRTYLGDALERALQAAEADGRRVLMLHPSWMPPLAKRLAPDATPLPGAAPQGGGP